MPKDSKGNHYDVGPGEKRMAPAELRRIANNLRFKAKMLEQLADQCDGKMSETADRMLYELTLLIDQHERKQ